jgi:hypothetical protein
MRGVIWGLLVCNLVFFGYQFLLQPDRSQSATVARGSASDVSVVRLLSEVSSSQLESLSFANEAVESGLMRQPYCAELGPFAGEAIANEFVATRAGGRRMRTEARSAPSDVQYRVYMSVQESREAASAQLARLRAAIAENQLGYDSFVISGGELENGISLGLFSERANALDVDARLGVLGFDVQVREEAKLREEIWVLSPDFASSEQFNLWWSEIASTYADLRGREKLCETIAQPF